MVAAVCTGTDYTCAVEPSTLPCDWEVFNISVPQLLYFVILKAGPRSSVWIFAAVAFEKFANFLKAAFLSEQKLHTFLSYCKLDGDEFVQVHVMH